MDWATITIAATLTALTVAAWARAAYRVWSGEPVVPFESRRDVPWRFADLLMIALFYLLASYAFLGICLLIASWAGGEQVDLLGAPDKEETTTAGTLLVTTATSVAANLAATGFALLWIFSHTDATSSDFGWRRDTIGNDVRLGLWAFAAIAAPIYGLQALLSPLTSEQHPIIEVLQRERTPLLYFLTGLSAVAVAPLAEEFCFRVLLQGWLEAFAARRASPDREKGISPIMDSGQMKPNLKGIMGLIPFSRSGGLAIFASSLIFALMHVGHGAAPIPLFFLALMLGYLYRRTHRLLPSVTVHFCLNACSYLMLCLASPGSGGTP